MSTKLMLDPWTIKYAHRLTEYNFFCWPMKNSCHLVFSCCCWVVVVLCFFVCFFGGVGQMLSFASTSDQWHGQLTMSNTEQHDGSWISTAKHPASTPPWTLQNGQHYNNLAKKAQQMFYKFHHGDVSVNFKILPKPSSRLYSGKKNCSYDNTSCRTQCHFPQEPSQTRTDCPRSSRRPSFWTVSSPGSLASQSYLERKKLTSHPPIYLPSLLPPTQFPSKPPHIGHNVRIFNLLKLDIYLMQEEEIRKTTG